MTPAHDYEFDIPGDVRILQLAKLLHVGMTPYEATNVLGFLSEDEFDFSSDPDIREQEEDTLARAIAESPQVVEMRKSLEREGDAIGLSTDEVRGFLRSAAYTPPSRVDENSPLCQSFKVTERYSNDGELIQRTTEVKLVDKLKAIDMDNRLQGRYNDNIAIGPSDSLMQALMLADKQNTLFNKDTNASPNTTPTNTNND